MIQHFFSLEQPFSTNRTQIIFLDSTNRKLFSIPQYQLHTYRQKRERVERESLRFQ